MATLVLSAAGSAIGGTFGGGLLGLSGAVIGRAVGATVGSVIDQRLFGERRPPVDIGKVNQFRVMSSGEGRAVPRLYGRMRMAGHVIWASRFRETVKTAGGGKGTPSGSATRSYSYSVSFAVALCEGEVTRLGRVWADGKPLDLSGIRYTLYSGTDDQLPDPVITAVEGAARTPAYRGVAYVVFEDLALAGFGNRIPQLSFEVIRRPAPVAGAVADAGRQIKGLALVPGSGEYTLATEPVTITKDKGVVDTANVHNTSQRPDLLLSLDQMQAEAPNLKSVSLVASWFGDDLRCDRCTLRPKVEHAGTEQASLPWLVSGLDRTTASEVGRVDGRPGYGGTPTDQSVMDAIAEIKGRGLEVMFYPFILMDVRPGNGLIDPWTGTAEQPEAPWRGRITGSLAPGQAGSPDKTAAASAEVAAFFGSAAPADFAASGGTVGYAGPDEWSYRRFILHYARLCQAAGGVEAFCIGSEMRALMQLRGAGATFPAVEAMRQLAADVRAILGPATKIGYAADWSEYFGYHPQDGSGDVWYHLDPLWADVNIDFVGIDNYMPLSDWREGEDHADAGWGRITNLDYLKANIEGGEGYDWYYAGNPARDAQDRAAISDGAYNEPWVFRYKDIRNWWSRQHFNRPGGVRDVEPTAWQPELKPVWFTELGCPAIDKGTNQPNVFVDAHSSETARPYYSTGARDDEIQARYLQAMHDYWGKAANNPVSQVYGSRMIEMGRAHVWAWDARPWPDFPGRGKVWSDVMNYRAGHWVSGRLASVPVADAVRELCSAARVAQVDVTKLEGLVRGYAIGGVESARDSIGALMLAHDFDAGDDGDVLRFRSRGKRVDSTVERPALLQPSGERDGATVVMAPEAELPELVRLTHIRDDGEYRTGVAQALHGGAAEAFTEDLALPLVVLTSEGRRLAQARIVDAHAGREGITLDLPLSRLDLAAGDVISLEGGAARYRVSRVEAGEALRVEAVKMAEPDLARGPGLDMSLEADTAGDDDDDFSPAVLEGPVALHGEILDLPLPGLDEATLTAVVAVAGSPWAPAAIHVAPEDYNYELAAVADRSAAIGTTTGLLRAATPGIWSRSGTTLRMATGTLQSLPEIDVLNGGNLLAVRAAGGGEWELVQFRDAVLIGEREYRIGPLLRGQGGTEHLAGATLPAGADVVVIDARVVPVTLRQDARGLARHYRIGDAEKPYTDASYQHLVETIEGLHLRPYAPAHLRAARDASGDLNITWIRRSRVDGDGWGTTEVPLGEASESYVLRVVKAGQVLRETSLAQPVFFYTAAEQALDGAIAPFEIDVAQVSERFGPGIFSRITING